MAYTYRYPHYAVATDCVVFGLAPNELEVLLIERGEEPHAGSWALPGGFLKPDEGLDDAALRELREETGLERLFLEQLYTFGAPGRDPRERVLSVAYYALVNRDEHPAVGGSDARRAAWFPVARLPTLAFDHRQILDAARERLKGKVRYQPIGFELLPKKFTLSQLQRMYEIILERPLDKRNFRRKILAMGLLIELDEKETGVAHRAARLYRFDRRKYATLHRQGFNFEV